MAYRKNGMVCGNCKFFGYHEAYSQDNGKPCCNAPVPQWAIKGWNSFGSTRFVLYDSDLAEMCESFELRREKYEQ